MRAIGAVRHERRSLQLFRPVRELNRSLVKPRHGEVNAVCRSWPEAQDQIFSSS
jgi:hypothetical protein